MNINNITFPHLLLSFAMGAGMTLLLFQFTGVMAFVIVTLLMGLAGGTNNWLLDRRLIAAHNDNA